MMSRRLLLLYCGLGLLGGLFGGNGGFGPGGVGVASAQSLQGYVYWDMDGNGLLDSDTRELENGVIDVQVELRPCSGGGGTDDEDDEEDDEDDENGNGRVLTTAKTVWPPTYPNEQRIPGHSAIYPHAGYYRLDLAYTGNCLLSNEQLAGLQDGDGNTAGAVGCYLSVVATRDYQITSSFPLVVETGTGGNYDDDGDEGSDGAFPWLPHNDNQGGEISSGGANRGYRARTSRCFGYHESRREWYAWEDVAAAAAAAFPSPARDDWPSGAQKISLPNDARYGYDSHLPTQQQYDRTLSVPPLGLEARAWPLPLRFRSGLMLGLEFGSGDAIEGEEGGDHEGANVPSGEGAAGGGSGPGEDYDPTEGENDDGARFRFESMPTGDALSFRAYLADEAMRQDIQSDGDGGGAASPMQQGSDASANYRHANNRGLLEDPLALGEVLGSFLEERLRRQARAAGRELAFLKLALLNQWSMVMVSDTMDSSADGIGQRRRNYHVSGGRNLRGTRTSSSSSVWREIATPRSHSFLVAHCDPDTSAQPPRQTSLRGTDDGRRIATRKALALPSPHLVFQIQVYAKFVDPPGAASGSAAAEGAASRASSNFGEDLAVELNRHRNELIARMRQRSGYGQECNPAGSSSSASSSSANAAPEYGAMAVDEYTEIEIGVVNRFDCDKLLPLYYYALDALAAREVPPVGVDAIAGEDDTDGEEEILQLSRAIELLRKDDGYYGAYAEDGGGSSDNASGGMAPGLLAVIAVASTLAILFIAGGMYVKRERDKVQQEKERRKIAREARMLAKEEKRKEKTKKSGYVESEDGENSVGIRSMEASARGKKIINRLSSYNDTGDDELNRLFSSFDDGEEKPDGRESEGGSATGQAQHQRPTSKKKKSRRKKKRDNCSELDSNAASYPSGLNHSNASGLNRSASARSNDMSTALDTSTTPEGKSKEDGVDKSRANEEVDEDQSNGDDEEHTASLPPPRKIKLPKRDKMEKGISDLSERLASSLRRSLNHSIPAVAINTAGETEEPGTGKARKEKRKSRKSNFAPLEKVDDGEEECAGVTSSGEAPSSRPGRKKNRPTLDKMVRSFRNSFTPVTDKDEGGAAATETKERKGKRKARATTPTAGMPARGISRAFGSMKMSMRRNLIGELSSSSDESSGSSSDSDSSDDDSSSSLSSGSEERTNKRHFKRKARKEYKMKDAAVTKERKAGKSAHQHSYDGHGRHHDKQNEEPHPEKKVLSDVVAQDRRLQMASQQDGNRRLQLASRQDGSSRRLNQENAELHDSEMTQTNNYLPHVKDQQRPNPPSRGSSHRSVGSKTKSSLSNSEFDTSLQSVHRGSKGSRASSRSSRKKGSRRRTQESNRELEGGVHRDGIKEKSKSKRHSVASEKKDSRPRREREQRRNTRPSLSQLRSSLSSSLSLKKKGGDLSETAAEALGEFDHHGSVELEQVHSERGSGRGVRRAASERVSNAGGGGTSRRASMPTRPRTSAGGGDDRRKKKPSSNKKENRSSKNRRHSEHKSGTRSKPDNEGATAAKRSKRKSTTARAMD